MFRNILDLVIPVLFYYHYMSMSIYFKDHFSKEAAKKYRYRIDIPVTVILIAYIILNIVDWTFFGGARINFVINNIIQ